MNLFKKIPLFLLVLIVSQCQSPNPQPTPNPNVVSTKNVQEVKRKRTPLTSEFKEYWYAGDAELTSYELEQVRYGEVRKGHAVSVFVTEDFSKSRYVKLDYPKAHPEDRVSVLKFNLNKQFITGIYDYSVMQSVFTPVDRDNYPNSLRVTTSNIEWCGQFLTRAELQNNQYRVRYNSYFDGEEDKTLILEKNILEDELWNQIRLNPQKLPQGVIDIIPGILTQELTHHPLKVEKASAILINKKDTLRYELTYKTIPRKLVIAFEANFPYKILAWEESFKTVKGWGMTPKMMTTKAKRIATTKQKYWELKYVKDEKLRSEELKINH